MGGFKLGTMTLGSLFKKPETVLYPIQQKEMPAGLKGHVAVDVEKCILCSICAKKCPADAIEVDKPGHTWGINYYRCVQCGSCTRECPKGCLTMEPTYAPVSTTKGVASFEVPVKEKPAPKPPAKKADAAAEGDGAEGKPAPKPPAKKADAVAEAAEAAKEETPVKSEAAE